MNTVHVYDVCDAIILCLKNEKSFQQIYNISSPSDTTINDVYSVITNVIPCEVYNLIFEKIRSPFLVKLKVSSSTGWVSQIF